MEKELAVSFNAVLSGELSKEIADLQKELSSRFDEKRFYDSSPHLAIATKFMTEEESEKFIETIKKEFEQEKAFEIEFDDFTLSSDRRYIFLNLNKPSREKIFKLYNRAMKVAKKIGAEGMQGNPPKYPYFPHISIIKLDEKDACKAIRMILHNLKGRKMLVTKLEITRQQDDDGGFAYFPSISVLDLTQE